MVMVLGMSTMTAFAAVTPATNRTRETDSSVTVSNPSSGQTYTLYRIFYADMGANDAITYNTNGAALADNNYFELNANGFVVLCIWCSYCNRRWYRSGNTQKNG